MPVLHQHPESSKIRISLLGSSLKIQNSRLIFSSSLPTWGLSLMFYVVYYFTVVLNHAGFSKHSSLLSVAHRLPNYQLHQHSKWDVKEISLLAVLQKFGTLDTHTHTHTHTTLLFLSSVTRWNICSQDWFILAWEWQRWLWNASSYLSQCN